MTRKIKFHSFHILFRLFAYLADRSGGWNVFVQPKLLMGSLIVSFGLTIPKNVQAQNKSANDKKKDFLKDIKDTIKSKEVEELVYCYVSEQMPQYPGGEEELLNFISRNLKYPKEAILNKIQGKVMVRFVITEKGDVEKVEVIRSLYPACDQEAVRIVKSFSKFTPGKQNGRPAKVWYTIPISFKIE